MLYYFRQGVYYLPILVLCFLQTTCQKTSPIAVQNLKIEFDEPYQDSKVHCGEFDNSTSFGNTFAISPDGDIIVSYLKQENGESGKAPNENAILDFSIGSIDWKKEQISTTTSILTTKWRQRTAFAWDANSNIIFNNLDENQEKLLRNSNYLESTILSPEDKQNYKLSGQIQSFPLPFNYIKQQFNQKGWNYNIYGHPVIYKENKRVSTDKASGTNNSFGVPSDTFLSESNKPDSILRSAKKSNLKIPVKFLDIPKGSDNVLFFTADFFVPYKEEAKKNRKAVQHFYFSFQNLGKYNVAKYTNGIEGLEIIEEFKLESPWVNLSWGGEEILWISTNITYPIYNRNVSFSAKGVELYEIIHSDSYEAQIITDISENKSIGIVANFSQKKTEMYLVNFNIAKSIYLGTCSNFELQ